MSAHEANRIYVLDRSAYDSALQRGDISSESLYFVRELSSNNPNILSLYIGTARQADIWDITGIISVDFNDPQNNYNIPSTYQVPNKMLLCKQENNDDLIYHIFMWDSTTRRFLDCGGQTNNVHVVSQLPDVSAANTNEVYAVIGSDSVSLYVFNGTQFIQAGSDIEPDNITILKDSNNVISGVGANVSGQTFSIGGTDYTAGTGSEVFNDYSGTNKSGGNNVSIFGHDNSIIGNNSAVFGSNNALKGNYSLVSGYNNNVSTNGSYSIISGTGNTISNCEETLVIGRGNALTVTDCDTSIIYGTGNDLSGATIDDCLVGGQNNMYRGVHAEQSMFAGNSMSSDGATINYSFILANAVTCMGARITESGIYGNGHTMSGSNVDESIICGAGHTLHDSISDSAVFGSGNIVGNITNCLIAGTSCNITSGSSGIAVGSGLSGDVMYSAIFGEYNYVSYSYPSQQSPAFCIGSGDVNTNERKNATVIDRQGNIVTAGNVIASTGVALFTIRTTQSTVAADDSTYTFSILPRNGAETILSDTYTISSVSITDITQMPKADADNYLSGNSSTSQAMASDYNSILIFKKSTSLTDISDSLTNFKAIDSTKIHLLNPDLDISQYDILHIMLFYDGFAMCAIAGGYSMS